MEVYFDLGFIHTNEIRVIYHYHHFGCSQSGVEPRLSLPNGNVLNRSLSQGVAVTVAIA